MKTIILSIIMTTSAISFADRGDWVDSASMEIKLRQSIQSNDQGPYSNYIYQQNLNKKCDLYIQSNDEINLMANQQLAGKASIQDQVTYNDADSVGSSVTTQFNFVTADGKVQISAVCIDQGVLFRSVPTLGELVQLLSKRKVMEVKYRY